MTYEYIHMVCNYKITSEFRPQAEVYSQSCESDYCY